MAIINFDATQVAPQQALEAIPAGWYRAAVTTSELEPTSDGTGMRLNYQLTILEGPFKGRIIFDGFNLENKSPQAVEISRAQLSALCHATGVLRVQESSALHNIPILVKISLDAKRTVDAAGNVLNPATKQPYAEGAAGTKTYEAQNKVKGFKNVNDGAPSDQAAAAGGAGVPVPGWATAKAAVPAPAAAATPAASTAPATTSNALPPWMSANASQPANPTPAPSVAAPTAAPAPSPTAAPSPAAVTAPKSPKGPKKAAAAPVAVEERKFYVYFADDNMPVKKESEVAAMLTQGMPVDTPLLLEKDMESGDWHDAAFYKIGATLAGAFATPAPAAAAAPNDTLPPWQRPV